MQAPHFLKVAVLTHPTFLGKLGGLRVDVGHILLVLLSIFVGAAAGYLEAEPTTTLVAALSSWATAKPLLIGALIAGLGALVNQAKQSYVVPSSGSTAPVIPPAPPALTIITLCLLLPGCTPAKQAVVADALEAEAACVTHQVYDLHQTDAIVVIEACGPEEGAVILSLLDGIFASKSAASLPPAQLEALKASAHAASAKYPRPAPAP